MDMEAQEIVGDGCPNPVLLDLLDRSPSMVAVPLNEYLKEDHPRVKLYHACDTVEMLLRLLVICSISGHEVLEDKLRGSLAQGIERPTLRNWFNMARELAMFGGDAPPVFDGVSAFVEGPLTEFLEGSGDQNDIETSFMALRNRLAHGGGLIEKEAIRLLDIWQEKFEEMMLECAMLGSWELVARDSDDNWKSMKGAGESLEVKEGVLPEAGEQSDEVWLRFGDSALSVWPLAIFGYPIPVDGKYDGKETFQVYTRHEEDFLSYTPVGAFGIGYSKSGQRAKDEFERIFRCGEEKLQKGMQVMDFRKEMRRDSGDMIGRQSELEKAKERIGEREQGMLWISGNPGMGKSLMMARLAMDLEKSDCAESEQDTRELVLFYRFRQSDLKRSSRDAMVQFVVERLVAGNALRDGFKDEKGSKPQKRLESALGMLREDMRAVIFLDGLDEIHGRDKKFVEEIPLGIRVPRLLWVCAGLPNPGIEEAMRQLGGEAIFPEGLPPMCADDIRKMLFEKIGPFRKVLLKGDVEKDERIENDFMDLVVKRASGNPLYVRYVSGDVLSRKYRVLDGEEDLPESLVAYHEVNLQGLGVGDLQAVVTPLLATLACAYESLTLEQIVTFFAWRYDEDDEEFIKQGLSEINPMLSKLPNADGDTTYEFYHKSARDHMLTSRLCKRAIKSVKTAFADLALDDDPSPALTDYALRLGVQHLIDVDRKQEAGELLLDMKRLAMMIDWGVDVSHIYEWCMKLGGEEFLAQYPAVVKEALQGDIDEKVFHTCSHVDHILVFGGFLELGITINELLLSAAVRSLGEEHSYTLSFASKLGVFQREKGEYNEAEPLLRRVWNAREKILGSQHPDTLMSIYELGRLFVAKGDIENAEPLIRMAHEGNDKSLGPENSQTLESLNGLAQIFHLKRNYAAAEPLMRQALEGREKIFGLEHRETLWSLNNLGAVLANKGDFEEAEGLLRKALQTKVKLFGPSHPSTLQSAHNFGNLNELKGNRKEAIKLFRQAFEGRKRVLGLKHSSTLSSGKCLVKLLIKVGKVNDAEKVRMDIGDQEKAEPFFRRATPLMNQLGDKLGVNPIDSVIVRNDGKVGRNSRCPCGSGKKYKHCCGKA